MDIYLPKGLVKAVKDRFETYEKIFGRDTDLKKENFQEDVYLLCYLILLSIAEGRNDKGQANTSFKQVAGISSTELKYFISGYRNAVDLLEGVNRKVRKSKRVIFPELLHVLPSYSKGGEGRKSFTMKYQFTDSMKGEPLVKIKLVNERRIKKIGSGKKSMMG